MQNMAVINAILYHKQPSYLTKIFVERDVEVQYFAKEVCENMSTNVETPLYPGSTKFTRLSIVLGFMNLKAHYKKD